MGQAGVARTGAVKFIQSRLYSAASRCRPSSPIAVSSSEGSVIAGRAVEVFVVGHGSGSGPPPRPSQRARTADCPCSSIARSYVPQPMSDRGAHDRDRAWLSLADEGTPAERIGVLGF